MAKKFSEVRKTLRAEGWSKVRQAGSHETWESADGARVVTVAGKDSDTVPVGTLAAMRQRQDCEICVEGLPSSSTSRLKTAHGATHSPDVDGVFALGVTRAEVESRMAEALEAHLAHLRESGRPRSRSAHRHRANAA